MVRVLSILLVLTLSSSALAEETVSPPVINAGLQHSNPICAGDTIKLDASGKEPLHFFVFLVNRDSKRGRTIVVIEQVCGQTQTEVDLTIPAAMVEENTQWQLIVAAVRPDDFSVYNLDPRNRFSRAYLAQHPVAPSRFGRWVGLHYWMLDLSSECTDL